MINSYHIQLNPSQAMANESFCQILYFLLRSNLQTLAVAENASKEIVVGNESEGFSPLKMLTFAHQELRSRLMLEKPERSNSLAESESPPLAGTCSSDSNTKRSPADVSVDDVNGTLKELNGVNTLSVMTTQDVKKKTKMKKIVSIFRRSGKKSSKNYGVDNGQHIDKEATSSLSNSTTIVNQGKRSTRPIQPVSSSSLRKDQNTGISRTIPKAPEALLPILPTVVLLENMGRLISNLDVLCKRVEGSLLKSFSRKMADYAMSPWSTSKDLALEEATLDLRNGLKSVNCEGSYDETTASSITAGRRECFPVMNPAKASEFLLYLNPEECYILPSAHFPLLLSFRSVQNEDISSVELNDSHLHNGGFGYVDVDTLYRTHVEFVSISNNGVGVGSKDSAYVCHAAVGGKILQSDRRYVAIALNLYQYIISMIIYPVSNLYRNAYSFF